MCLVRWENVELVEVELKFLIWNLFHFFSLFNFVCVCEVIFSIQKKKRVGFWQIKTQKMNQPIVAGLLVLLVCPNAFEVNALNNGLALTPPMGWMSWQRYRCIIDCDTYPDECIR